MRTMIEQLRAGEISADDAVAQLARLPFAEVGQARIDHHRAIRQGLPEAVYGPGKSPQQCVEIVGELLTNGTGPVLITRIDEAQRKALEAAHSDAVSLGDVMAWRRTPVAGDVTVAVITAGTADTPVADECQATLEAYGVDVDRIHDVGVAGLHRLLAELDRVTSADIVVVVAGMEGALASVIGGLVARPVIAVPTSVGYGAGLEGVTALLGMLASCAAGITVVGIDNGYGAAVGAMRMLSLGTR